MIALKGSAEYIRMLLMVCNGVCCICGFFLFVFGIVGVSNRTSLALMLKHCDGDLGHFSDLLDIPDVFKGLAAFMIVVGLISMCYGAIGYYAVFNNDQTMLLGFAGMVLALMLLEVSLVVYAIVDQERKLYYVKTKLYKSLVNTYQGVEKLELVDPMSYRSPGNEAATSWRITELRFQCCGANDFFDYQTFRWNNDIEVEGRRYTAVVPYSCCKNVVDILGFNAYNITQCLMGQTNAINTEGCHKAWSALMRYFSVMAVVLAALDLAFKIVLFLGSSFLWWNVQNISNQYKEDRESGDERTSE